MPPLHCSQFAERCSVSNMIDARKTSIVHVQRCDLCQLAHQTLSRATRLSGDSAIHSGLALVQCACVKLFISLTPLPICKPHVLWVAVDIAAHCFTVPLNSRLRLGSSFLNLCVFGGSCLCLGDMFCVLSPIIQELLMQWVESCFVHKCLECSFCVDVIDPFHNDTGTMYMCNGPFSRRRHNGFTIDMDAILVGKTLVYGLCGA